ncbi:MAG TPA: DMT family transporter [Anaerolineae bacterium]|nr:DMT family transporter [Anaerolineae bacterium]
MKRFKSYYAVTMAVIFWGSSFVATKIVLRELNPTTIIPIRFGMGLLILTVANRRGNFRPIDLKAMPMLALLGFLGITLHAWLQATGLKTVAATVTAWVIATIPVFVALLGWAFLGERLSLLRLGGIVLAASGAVTVVSGGDLRALLAGRVGTVGDILIGISALNWALFTVLSKRVLRSDAHRPTGGGTGQGHAIQMMLYVMAFGWIFSLPGMILDKGWLALQTLSSQGWWALVFLGIACSGLAYLFWYEALDRIAATQAGVFLYFEPLVTAVVAWPTLGEAITGVIALGGAAILLGVWLVNQR